MAISIIGLGKLGLCTAACFAREGVSVIGYDNDPERVSLLGEHKCYIDEPGLEDMLNEVFINHDFAVTGDIQVAIEHTNQTFIIVPTPSDERGFFSNDIIMQVLSDLAIPLKVKKEFHVINIVSTVMPGSCHRFISYLENKTGKISGKDFGLTYNPEFIAIGTIINDFKNPDMILIGADDQKSAPKISDTYRGFSSNFQIMSIINAEITKLSLNCYLTTKISFVNELATICETIPGADVDCVTGAIGCDRRVGSKLLKAGVGFGGPCLPRDVIAWAAYSEQKNYRARIPEAVKYINDAVIGRIISLILCHVPSNGIVDIYGIGYKPGATLTEGSQSIILRDKLSEIGYTVRMFESRANASGLPTAKAIVAMSDHAAIQEDIITHDCVFIDPWRKFKNVQHLCTYYGLGLGHV